MKRSLERIAGLFVLTAGLFGLKWFGCMSAKITEQNKTTGSITATIHVSRLSPGEELKIILTAPNHANTHLTISSRPRARTRLFDSGRGYENLERISTYLKNHSPDGPVLTKI